METSMPDRHYNDDEIAAIFRAATEGAASRAVPGSADGLTLRDLQDIAREVGISPAAVSRAAQALDRPHEADVAQTFLGLPVAVECTVALERNLTDTEWELLTVRLREVFRARGTVRTQGSLREWSNGNLHALIEPTPDGYRLRLSTYKGNARSWAGIGALMLGASALVVVMSATHGALFHGAPGVVVPGALGAFFLVNGTIRLPSWARERRQQMDRIAAQVVQMMQDDRDKLPSPSPDNA